ncbi:MULTISPECIES: YesL family protein [Enterococcus]|uniref:DUF624 domain-containing protein n=1 Tax=Enterococcus sulfureus ATCC 49903 TaxID=1140003 RepID=S0LAK8_9ENTE|nr:DUF624 domain-containing protein [Enterococcus sulfureus]EOT49403.1 hypothetical protein OMY_00331 [Enterococcus sulfureus ATCC 49903]EOT87270.1 hypothetical protein I573_00326 [Enterococcus sulfureus ATCC 49903]
MVSSGIQRLFYVAWSMIKLNLYFLVCTCIGGIVFGIGPAFQALSDLLNEYGMSYQELTFKRFFTQFKLNFKIGNQSYWLATSFTLLLGYNLYLSIQLQGLIWLMIDLLLLTTLLLVNVTYLYMTLYQSTYEIPFSQLLKLAVISVFYHFATFLKVVIGLISIAILTWYFKGLAVFLSVTLVAVWSGYATKNIRQMIDGKLDSHA